MFFFISNLMKSSVVYAAILLTHVCKIWDNDLTESIRFVINLQIFKKPEIGITNWCKEILGLEFTFCHFFRENVPLALGGYFSLERREKSCWHLITFQDTFLQIVKAHEYRASLRTFFACPFVHTFYFPSLLQVNYRTTLQYTQLCFWNRIH